MHMRNSFLIKFLAALFAFALIGAACSNGDTTTDAAADDSGIAVEDDKKTDDMASDADAPTVDTAAATLTRDLTGLLVDHEYLAGLAVLQGVTEGPDSGAFKAAAGALDKNSVQLSEVVGSVYGDAGAKKFLSLWRAHIGFFVDYTLAKAGGDMAGQKVALKKLDGYRNDFGAFIEGATEGGLPADAVADALTPHVESTIAAIDSVIAG